MKILIIGSGGREHALAWKLAQSKKVEKIYTAPGNGGTAVEEKTENLPMDGMESTSSEGQKMLLEFARNKNIDLTIVGPEAPLAAGIVDRFREAGLSIVGPGQKEARLETSKVYSKSFMEKYGVRTAKSRFFTNLENSTEVRTDRGSPLAAALENVERHFGKSQVKHDAKKGKGRAKTGSVEAQSDSSPVPAVPPLVIKADGLAAGKGVVIASNAAEAKETLIAFMKSGALGDAGKSVIIEEYLEGIEVSMLAAVSVVPGKKGIIRPFIPARDHKRLREGSQGPNTGGMGAIAPLEDFTPDIQKDFETAILAPTLKGMLAEKMDYRGFIFFGLMVREGRCYLLEYNARLGDPETQAVLPLMDSDLAELCAVISDGTLGNMPADFSVKWKKGAVCAPVAVSEGYPGAYRSGFPIAINSTGFEKTGAKLFVAGAQRAAGGYMGSGLRTSGGRVLAVSALGSNADDARNKAYEALRFVGFEGMVYRKDIGLEKGGEQNHA